MNPAVLGAAKLKNFANCKIAVDGNSIMGGGANGNTNSKMGQILSALSPLSGSGVVFADCAISGQSWTDMVNNPADVNSAYVAGKINILVCSETTNCLLGGALTVQQTYDKAAQYLSERRAAHPDRKIVLCSSLPCGNGGGGHLTQVNLNFAAVDSMMAANWRSLGADAWVTYRQAGSPFNHLGDAASFNATRQYWPEVGSELHPNNLGLTVMAGYIISDGLMRLKKR